MKISHGTRMKAWHSNNGYGYATDNMLNSLHYLGHEVVQNDPSAPVQFWFDQPQHWRWNDSKQYRIGYHPWESTRLRRGWTKMMNECDEIWTPSPVVAKWYKRSGVKVPVYVYEHGVDTFSWTEHKRTIDDKFRILHVGGEAVRKGGDLTLDAFRTAFEGNKDVEITLKMNQQGWKINKYGQVSIISDMMSLPDLVNLHHSHHVFVYPSWGEGFGLSPLQAMATGMPTITTGAWAPYERFIPESQNLSSELVESPWPKLHPGRMFKPNFDELVDKLRFCYENYDSEVQKSMKVVPEIVQHYNWDRLTDEAFAGLENRLKNSW